MPNRRSARLKNYSDRKPWEDEVLEEVYAQRAAYSAEHGHDLRRIYEDLKQRKPGEQRRRAEQPQVLR